MAAFLSPAPAVALAVALPVPAAPRVLFRLAVVALVALGYPTSAVVLPGRVE